MYVIKKDGTREEFNVDKIIAAVNKSAARILYEFSTDEIAFICQFAYDRAESLKKDGITIQEMHNIVEGALERVNPAVAKSDGANMLKLDRLEGLLTKLVKIREAIM